MSASTRKTPATTGRMTLASTNARLDEFDTRFDRLEALLTGAVTKAPEAPVTTPEAPKGTERATFSVLRARLKEHKKAGAIKAGVTAKEAIEQGLMTEQGDLPGSPVAKVAKASTPKASKAKGKKASKAQKAAPAKVETPEGTALRSKTLPEFKAANPWAKDMSVREVAEAVVKGGQAISGAFYVGDRYRNLVLTGTFDGTGETKPAAKKAQAQVVVAETATEEPAWGSEAWIKATHPRQKDTPRNAKGQPTKKSEWPLRCTLEASGKFDREQVDALVAQANSLAN